MAKDFRNKTFGRILRGYNPDEVDEYIAYVSDEYRKLERRCADSERKLALALKKLDEMNQKFMGADNAENELAAAAISEARDEADRIIADANARASEITEHAEHEAAEKSRLILEEAAKGAEEILSGAEQDAAESKKTAESVYAAAGRMYGEVCAFRDSLFEIYNSHIESIERMTEEAERAMGVIEDTYEPDASEEYSPENPVDPDDGEVTEEPEDVRSDEEEHEPEPEEYEPADEDILPSEDLYIDLDELAEEDSQEPDDILLQDATGEPDEPVWEPEEAAEEDLSDELPDGLTDAYNDEPEFVVEPLDSDESDDFDTAEYDEIDTSLYDAIDKVVEDGEFTEDEGFRIDWSSRRAVEEDSDGYDEFDDDEEAAEPREESVEEPAQQSAFTNLDDLFTAEEQSDEMSLTDEFNLVFNSSNAKKNVEQIRRQPTIAPEKPKNPKKHQKF